jgi:hypothetical protein
METGQKAIVVKVKTTMHMKSEVRWHSREKLNDKVKKYASYEDVPDVIVLEIALGNFDSCISRVSVILPAKFLIDID